MYDLMDALPSKTVKCLDKGFVTLVDVMPRLVPDGQKTADYAVVQAARVSYGDGTKTVNEDRGLIRYLMRHSHTTPFEMIDFKFCMKLPIFCARQIIRHRTVSVNEYSGRYSIMKDEFYHPELDNVRQQSKTNKQGGDQQVEESTAKDFLAYLDEACIKAYQLYEKYINEGISREQARMVLPLNLYTEWYWKCNCHNLLHCLGLRCDKHAQWETRVFADAMLELVRPLIPWTIEAWEDYHDHRGATKLTRLEIDALKKTFAGFFVHPLDSDNKREQAEWVDKAKRMGLVVDDNYGIDDNYGN
jgi:thymidylate synthase (FAD)